jgi:hypothetical protein
MSWVLIKLVISGGVISFTSWFAGQNPRLAGLLVALPLTSMLALAFSYREYSDPIRSIEFARGIFVGVPISLLFFVPFLFADRLKFSFWMLYGTGVVLITCGWFLQKWMIK